jgi:hypothetical protein
LREKSEKLGRDQVDLPEIGQAWPAAGEITVLDESAGMGVALDSVALDQNDAILDRFAEVVSRVGGDRRHLPLKR